MEVQEGEASVGGVSVSRVSFFYTVSDLVNFMSLQFQLCSYLDRVRQKREQAMEGQVSDKD